MRRAPLSAPDRPTFRRLSSDEETALIERYQRGDSIAGQLLVEAFDGFIRQMAGRFRGRGLDDEDLVQEVKIGFLEAVRNYRRSFKCRLITYAHYVSQQAPRKALMQTGTTVRLPKNVHEGIALAKEQGIDTPEGLATAGLLREDLAITALGVKRRPIVSLDAGYADTLQSEEMDPEEHYLREEQRARAQRQAAVLLANLTARERDVVVARLGPSDGLVERLDDLARRYDVTRAAIRQVQVSAMSKIRTNARRLAMVDAEGWADLLARTPPGTRKRAKPPPDPDDPPESFLPKPDAVACGICHQPVPQPRKPGRPAKFCGPPKDCRAEALRRINNRAKAERQARIRLARERANATDPYLP